MNSSSGRSSHLCQRLIGLFLFSITFQILNLSLFAFDGLRRSPERAWISAIRINLQHPVVQLLRRGGHLSEPLEIANVSPRLLNNPRTIILLRFLMSGNDCERLE